LPRAAANFFLPLKGCVRRVLYMLALHVSTATATGPAAPTKGFERSKSAWRDDKETVRVSLRGCAREKTLRVLELIVVQRSGKARGSAGRDHFGREFTKASCHFRRPGTRKNTHTHREGLWAIGNNPPLYAHLPLMMLAIWRKSM